MRPLNVPPQMEPPRLELLPLFTSPLNVPPLMAKPLNMFTDSLNVPSSIAPLLIPMTMQSNVPPVMVPEEVLTYDFVGSFGSLLKVPPAMMPAFPMLAVNAPPLITPPASLRTAKPDVCDASTNVPSSMTPLFRRRFSLETLSAWPVNVNAHPASSVSTPSAYVQPSPDVPTGAPSAPISMVTGTTLANAAFGSSRQANARAVARTIRRFLMGVPFGQVNAQMLACKGSL